MDIVRVAVYSGRDVDILRVLAQVRSVDIVRVAFFSEGANNASVAVACLPACLSACLLYKWWQLQVCWQFWEC